MLGYVFLAIAIATEVVATAFLKFTSGENPKWWAFVIVVVGYLASFFALSQSLGTRRPARHRLRDLVGGRGRRHRADLVGVLQRVAHLGADRRHRPRHRRRRPSELGGKHA